MGIRFFPIAFLIFGVSSAFGTIHRYHAQHFFEDCQLECITAVEGISQEEKDLIVQSKYAISEELLSPFSVVSIRPNRLRLRDVDIHVYEVYGDEGWVVSVTSILGNHDQNQNTVFYYVDESGLITSEIRADLLGIGPVYRNELLDEADHFPEEQNYLVPLSIMDCGSLTADPWTWMDPDWENRKIVNRIIFVWNGNIFDRVSSRNSD